MVSGSNTDQNNVVNLEELTHLKGLLQSIHERIEKIENDVKGKLFKSKDQRELRMVLMGPPGAGMY
jgi:hypothetical protein